MSFALGVPPEVCVSVCARRGQTFGYGLIGGEPRRPLVVQLVEIFEVSDCRDLQEVETVAARLLKIPNIAKEVGTPVIVLTDAVGESASSRQANAHAFRGDHRHLPKTKKDGRAFFPQI